MTNTKPTEATTETPEQREKRLQFQRDYYRKNKDRLREQAAARRQADPEKHREAFRKYYAENAESRRAINASRARGMQQLTVGKAEKNHQPWTEAEDAELLASELTSHELALKLGRTYAAVNVRRARLRKEERERDLEAEELRQIALEDAPDSLED